MLIGGRFCGAVRYEAGTELFHETNRPQADCRRHASRAVLGAPVSMLAGGQDAHRVPLQPGRYRPDLQGRCRPGRNRRDHRTPGRTGSGFAEGPRPHGQQAGSLGNRRMQPTRAALDCFTALAIAP